MASDESNTIKTQEQRVAGVGNLVLGAVAAALGVLLLAAGSSISLGAGYDRIGPRMFPYAVGCGLLALGVLLAVPALLGRGAVRGQAEAAERLDWLPLLLLGAALALNVALLERAGFVAASAVLFWMAARAFRSSRPVRDAVVGLLVALVVYYAFSGGLGLYLPAGILGELF